MTTDEEMELTPGSRYVVHSISSENIAMRTTGTFTGYAYITKEDAGICIVLDESHADEAGLTRIIPVTMILAIDILTEHKKHGKSRDPETPRYFG